MTHKHNWEPKNLPVKILEVGEFTYKLWTHRDGSISQIKYNNEQVPVGMACAIQWEPKFEAGGIH
jgi:hypothetical protein